jgi:hypothetical protein
MFRQKAQRADSEMLSASCPAATYRASGLVLWRFLRVQIKGSNGNFSTRLGLA